MALLIRTLAALVGLLAVAGPAMAQTPPSAAAPPRTVDLLPPGEGAALAVPVIWAARPDAQDAEKVRPQGFRDAGQVVLRCRLSEPGAAPDGGLHGCVIGQESPIGRGLAAAALSLTARFKIDPKTYSGPPEAATVTVPIRWRALTTPIPARPAAFSGSVTGMDLITRPTFLARPTLDQIKAAQPKGQAGRVVLECTVAIDTTVKDCHPLEESPLGAGFGVAALSLTPLFKVEPEKDKDGKPQEAVVRLAFNFTP